MAGQLTLDSVPKEKEVKIVEIVGGWRIRQRLNQMGINTGDMIFVKRSGIMGGAILIQVHGTEVALGRGMAKKVIVSDK